MAKQVELERQAEEAERLRLEQDSEAKEKLQEIERQRSVAAEAQRLAEQANKEQLESVTEGDQTCGSTELAGASSMELSARSESCEDSKLEESTNDPCEITDADKDETKINTEAAAPVAFTIKRGNRDSSSVGKMEKRRKWSGKSEPGQNPDSLPVSAGISSQKLKELIDLKQSKAETPKIAKNDRKKSTKPSPDEDVEQDKITEHQAIKTDADPGSSTDTQAEPAESVKPKTEQRDGNIEGEGETSIKETHEPTNWLIIKNLMRPYTVTQLKEELTKFGPIVDDKFWTDKVKSKCCVLYESIEAAQQTKESMQGQHWPTSNPKSLVVDFINEDIYNHEITSDIKQPSLSKGAEKGRNNAVNGGLDKNSKKSNDRLSDRLEVGDAGSSSIRSRLGDKMGGDSLVDQNHDARNRLMDSQPKELDDFFRKTKAKPQLFWLPLDEGQADARAVEREDMEALGRWVGRRVMMLFFLSLSLSLFLSKAPLVRDNATKVAVGEGRCHGRGRVPPLPPFAAFQRKSRAETHTTKTSANGI